MSSIHFLATLLLSLTLQVGIVVVVLGVLTVARTRQTDFFWPTVGLVGVAVVVSTHTLYRFTILSHDLCWAYCLLSVGVLWGATGTFYLLIDGRAIGGVPCPTLKEWILGLSLVALVTAPTTWAIMYTTESQITRVALWTGIAILAFSVALVAGWLSIRAKVAARLHWSLWGLAGTAVAVMIGAFLELSGFDVIVAILTTEVMLVGIGLYSLHQETLPLRLNCLRPESSG